MRVSCSYALTRKTQGSKMMLESICSHDGLSNETTTTDGNWLYAKSFLLNGSQPCDKMILSCEFGSEIFDCYKGFSSVLTDEGLCCTFNAVHPKLMFKGFDANEHILGTINVKGYDINDNAGDFEYVTWTPEQGYYYSELSPYPFPVPGPGRYSNIKTNLS